MTTHSNRGFMMSAVRVLIGAAFCLGWPRPANARETVFRVDFGQAGKPCPYEKVGRFHGALPPRVRENFAAWNASVAHAERLTENGRAFLRIHAEKVDAAVQFSIDGGEIALPGVFELVVTARPQAAPLQFNLRQVGAPYHGFGEAEFPVAGAWKERRFIIQTRERCASNVAIFFCTGGGVTDIASVELARLGNEELAATVPRPDASVKNFFRNSRFPLGLPCGWNMDRDSRTATCGADAAHPGEGGLPSLAIKSAQGFALYSEPFQTNQPDKPHTITFMYQSDGACRVEVMDEGRSLAGKALVPSNGWQTATLNFVPPGEALCFCLRFTGSGTFRLDALRAFADSTAADLADRACEVALAPGRSEIAETRIQFADECAEVRFCVTGEAGGAVLKSRVADLYGTSVPLADLRVPDGAKRFDGALRFDVVPARPLGQFRIEAWVERDGRRISPYNEIVMTRLERPVFWDQDAPDSPFGCHFLASEPTLRMMKACGINWARLHDAGTEYCGWWNLEREKGQWTFMDEDIQRYRKNRIKIFAQLGTAPAWASHYGDLGCTYMGYFEKFLRPKNNEDFNAYVKTFVTRYKGVIDEYFVWNEPWGRWWESGQDAKFFGKDNAKRDFAELCRGAYRAVKAVDPSIKVAGFNTYGGGGGRLWTAGVLAAGGMEACDIIDFHLYTKNATCLADDSVAQAYRDAVGEIFDKVPNAGGKPIYMSEGQGGSTGSAGGGQRMTGLYKHAITWQQEEDTVGLAEKNCRYTVSLLAQKVAKVFLYTAHGYSSLARAPSFMVLLGADGYPHPGLAAYAHLTRSLEGKPFVRKVALGENRFAYLFAGRGGSCAVLCGGREAKLPFIQDPAIRWTDLFGNPLADPATLPGTMRYAASALPPDELAKHLTSPQ
ncbi:MAG TPA: hypothetical protein P5111_03245 [Kiritimatiellia bacterium]|nr:hypothetical protein [Kiritimatiellia bacterium]